MVGFVGDKFTPNFERKKSLIVPRAYFWVPCLPEPWPKAVGKASNGFRNDRSMELWYCFPSARISNVQILGAGPRGIQRKIFFTSQGITGKFRPIGIDRHINMSGALFLRDRGKIPAGETGPVRGSQQRVGYYPLADVFAPMGPDVITKFVPGPFALPSRPGRTLPYFRATR